MVENKIVALVKERKSNFEALRLLCMLMVLNLHSFGGYTHGTGVWQALDFFRESLSICAVNCFILISGYFGIKWKFKSFFNLIFQLFFYSVGIYLVVVTMGIVDWSLKDFLLRFACLITDSWDFAISYVLLWFASPFLNALSEKSTSRELLKYIIVLFLVLTIISMPRGSFYIYTLIYTIGRFLNKINIDNIRIPAKRGYLIITILIFLLVYGFLFSILQITDPGKINGLPLGLLGYYYASPLVILQAVFLFIIFSKFKFRSQFINWCASSCFAIYLIHMHPSIKYIGYYSLTENLYAYPPLQHIIYLVVLILTVFFVSIMIDKFRIVLSNSIYSLLCKIMGFVPKKWGNVDSYAPRLTQYL